MIGSVLPSGVSSCEAVGDHPDAQLLEEEEAALGRVAVGRRMDFTSGRWCARQALEGLGIGRCAILIGRRGQPLWPGGVVGSVTHCQGYRAAAAARREEFDAIGIDAEPHDSLPAGVIDHIAGPSERGALTALPGQHGVHWDRILFSAKESVFKAWFPSTGTWLDFDDVAIRFKPDRKSFRVVLAPDVPVVDWEGLLPRLEGRWCIDNGLVVTAVVSSSGRSLT